ncbi:hypothetical protein XPA_003102 [Xanthoria parietina]
MGNREGRIEEWKCWIAAADSSRSLWEKQKTAKIDWSQGLTGSTLFTAKMEASMMSSTDSDLFLLLLVMHDAATFPPPGSYDQDPSARRGEQRLLPWYGSSSQRWQSCRCTTATFISNQGVTSFGVL